MLAEGTTSGLELTVGADVVRRAASGDIQQISAATGLDANELRAAVVAWRIAGQAGFAAHSARPDVDPTAMIAGQQALGDRARVRGNMVSLETTQLRLDPNGQWWRFDADEDLGWLLTDGPADKPADLM